MVKMEKKWKSGFTAVWKSKYLYLMLLPLFVWLAVFSYGPMYGVILAFEDFSARKGILGSDWVGLQNFRRIFSTPMAVQSIITTLKVSFGRLIWEFPMGIILAILLTEMPGKRVKKVYQTIFTFPHFLSWVVVANIVQFFLGNAGVINGVLESLEIPAVGFLSSEQLFHPMLYITNIWKEAGWSAIIFMAAIAGIDQTLYEAAEIDGASRIRRIWHITLPGIKSTIAIMLILAVGGVMNAGFDQIFNMNNAMVENSARILDIYVYDLTFKSIPDYGFSTAVGLLKSVVNLILLVAANYIVGKINGESMFG